MPVMLRLNLFDRQAGYYYINEAFNLPFRILHFSFGNPSIRKGLGMVINGQCYMPNDKFRWWLVPELHRALILFREALICLSYPALENSEHRTINSER